MGSSSDVQHVSSPMLDWIRSKMEKAREVGDFPTFQNYEAMLKLWERRINEKISKEAEV